MRHDKELIFTLRRQGKSYRQIQKETGVSRATLSAWFQTEPWSQHLSVVKVGQMRSSGHILIMQNARKGKLAQLYKEAEAEAEREYKSFKAEPLFWAGLMAYAGEGDKRSRHLIRMTNSEFYLHKIFIAFVQKYLGVPKDRIKIGLLLYPEHNESLCKEMWANILVIERENFYKTQVLQGKEKVRRLQYGIAMSILSSTALKKKVLQWLSLAQDERFENAGMVQG